MKNNPQEAMLADMERMDQLEAEAVASKPQVKGVETKVMSIATAVALGVWPGSKLERQSEDLRVFTFSRHTECQNCDCAGGWYLAAGAKRHIWLERD